MNKNQLITQFSEGSVQSICRNEFYPLADNLTCSIIKEIFGREMSAFDVDRMPNHEYHVFRRSVKAKWTGEKRCPKQGEWYLSGSIIEAYRAPNDLPTPYHIARLVRTETITVEREI